MNYDMTIDEFNELSYEQKNELYPITVDIIYPNFYSLPDSWKIDNDILYRRDYIRWLNFGTTTHHSQYRFKNREHAEIFVQFNIELGNMNFMDDNETIF